MSTEQFILEHKGPVLKADVDHILRTAKAKLKDTGFSTFYTKKIYTVLVESVENIHKHSADEIPGPEFESLSAKEIGNSIEICCSNFILNEQINLLKEKIDHLNGLTRREVREYYKDAIAKSELTEKGGAGIGLIEIVKVTSNKVKYEFIPANDNLSIVKLTFRISIFNSDRMDAIIIQATDKSPLITFDPNGGLFEMEGDSRPENVRKFYQPVIDMLKASFDGMFNEKKIDQFKEEPFKFNFKLGYFNSSSAKFILDILNSINEYRMEGLNIKINWYFEEDDEDMMEAGEEFSNFINYPFSYIMIKE